LRDRPTRGRYDPEVRLSVIGCGYLGAVHAAAMASVGHTVVGIDVDAEKVAALAGGHAPFFEPGLDELLRAGLDAGTLTFSSDMSAAADADVHFIAVGTPQTASGAADLGYLDSALAALIPHLGPDSLVVGKSTVPVGFAATAADRVEAAGARLAWNPEFLREGFAVHDTLEPDRLVYGVRAGDERSVAELDATYATALATGIPRLVTDFATAELVKVAANAFLATKISFINAMAEVADAVGADVTQLADAIGQDVRIGRRFLNAGVGFGGGCLPKDIRGFMARADELGVGESVAFLRQVDAINLRGRDRVVERVVEQLGGDVTGHRVAILGLAFKPDSDDVRDSPALDVAVRLQGLGADVVAHDPKAVESARRRHPELSYADELDDALRGAEVVVLLTEWAEYRGLDPATTGDLVADRRIVDGRNCLDPAAWRAAGWTYRGMGRP
jgi:UDPglucose 6-dehydrogenase